MIMAAAVLPCQQQIFIKKSQNACLAFWPFEILHDDAIGIVSKIADEMCQAARQAAGAIVVAGQAKYVREPTLQLFEIKDGC